MSQPEVIVLEQGCAGPYGSREEGDLPAHCFVVAAECLLALFVGVPGSLVGE